MSIGIKIINYCSINALLSGNMLKPILWVSNHFSFCDRGIVNKENQNLLIYKNPFGIIFNAWDLTQNKEEKEHGWQFQIGGQVCDGHDKDRI